MVGKEHTWHKELDCYNCENARVGKNSKGIRNHYKMGKYCHKKLGKNNYL